ELVPDVPIIALTATATREVCDDIIRYLGFRDPYSVFRRTFARDNLSIVVRKADDKVRKLLDVLRKVNGPAIVYVRSRRATKELATLLRSEEHTSELQSRENLVCRLLLEKKK